MLHDWLGRTFLKCTIFYVKLDITLIQLVCRYNGYLFTLLQQQRCCSCDICGMMLMDVMLTFVQACYGIQNIPEGNWLCRTCALNIQPRCLLCPKTAGAMKSTKQAVVLFFSTMLDNVLSGCIGCVFLICTTCHRLFFMVALFNRADHIYLHYVVCYSFFFLSSPNLSGRRLDVCHTSTHGVDLVRIQDGGLKRAARGLLEMQDAKSRHLCTIIQICRAISSQVRHVSTIGKKLVKQQYLFQMSPQYGELRSTSG